MFLKSQLFKNANTMAITEKGARYPMIEIGQNTTKESIRKQVVDLSFKNSNEARAYYFLHLLCTIIDVYGKEVFKQAAD